MYDFCRRPRNTTYQRDDASGEAGLDYAMARYYASRSGRFMTPDPGHVGANVANPQSWNAYVYALNDPVNFIDPDGLKKSCPKEQKAGQICVDVEGTASSGGGGSGFDFGWWPSFDEWTRRLASWGRQEPLSPPASPPASQTTGNKEGKSQFAVAKEWVCSAIPDGRTIGLTGAMGVHGGGTGSIEVVLNYNTGELSAFASGGLFGGVNGGASGGPFVGLIYGLGDSNANYSKGFTGISGSAPSGFGGFIQISSGTPQHPEKLNLAGPKVIAASWTPSLLTGGAGGTGFATYSSPPLRIGQQFVTNNDFDWILFRARSLCN